ncbi:hypothetical protein ANO11243_087180 [Dothideomycetidae sp. 11243]|nr:hypothetical protein ANO11243_087180 [fungal sp. No.11243]
MYKLTICFTKLSILCFYQRMFSTHKTFTLTCKLLGVVILGWVTGAVFATVFQCTPVEYTWKGKASGIKGSCIDLQASWYTNCIFNISTDVLIVLLPMLVVRKLQMRTREKIQLCALFALGLMSVTTNSLYSHIN